MEHECALFRIQPSPEPIEEHGLDVRADSLGMGVVRGQHVEIGDEEQALVVVLKPPPRVERSHEMPEMPWPGGPVPG